MSFHITHKDKTFVIDPFGDAKPGAYVLYFSEYRRGDAYIGKIESVNDAGVLFLPNGIVGLDQPYILLKECVDVDDVTTSELGEAYDGDRIDAHRDTLFTSGTPESPKPVDQSPRELTSQERQLERWTTMTRVFTDNLKKGVPYAIKHKNSEDILYGLYSRLLDPETALFRYLNGELKVSVHKLESGMVEIQEVVEGKEAF